MNDSQICKETLGLFLEELCERPAAQTCDNCGKSICQNHRFPHQTQGKSMKVCLSCIAVLDPRPTSEIELYSPERPIWRRKMMNRFKEEYPFLVFMEEDYSVLFDTYVGSDFDDDANDESYFDS